MEILGLKSDLVSRPLRQGGLLTIVLAVIGVAPGAWAGSEIVRPPRLEDFSPQAREFLDTSLESLTVASRKDGKAVPIRACVLHVPAKEGASDSRETLHLLDFTRDPPQLVASFKGEYPENANRRESAGLLGPPMVVEGQEYQYAPVFQDVSKSGAPYTRVGDATPRLEDLSEHLKTGSPVLRSGRDIVFSRGPGVPPLGAGALGMPAGGRVLFDQRVLDSYSTPDPYRAPNSLKGVFMNSYYGNLDPVLQKLRRPGDFWNWQPNPDFRNMDSWSALKIFILYHQEAGGAVCDMTSPQFPADPMLKIKLPVDATGEGCLKSTGETMPEVKPDPKAMIAEAKKLEAAVEAKAKEPRKVPRAIPVRRARLVAQGVAANRVRFVKHLNFRRELVDRVVVIAPNGKCTYWGVSAISIQGGLVKSGIQTLGTFDPSTVDPCPQ